MRQASALVRSARGEVCKPVGLESTERPTHAARRHSAYSVSVCLEEAAAEVAVVDPRRVRLGRIDFRGNVTVVHVRYLTSGRIPWLLRERLATLTALPSNSSSAVGQPAQTAFMAVTRGIRLAAWAAAAGPAADASGPRADVGNPVVPVVRRPSSRIMSR
jgi:hypothetical protein